MSILGDRIKKERENLNLSREDLAKKIGVSYSAIAMYEQGNREPNTSLLIKLCEVFNCSMDYLMGKSDFKTYKEDFENYNINNSKIIILKTIDSFYYEYVAPCSLKESDIDKIVDLLSNVNKSNVKEVKKQLNSFVNSFDEEKRKKVEKLIHIIIRELTDDIKSKNIFLYLTDLIRKENSNKSNISFNYYMCPVYGQISAGEPNWVEQNIEGRLPIDPNLMNIINPEEYFFLRVNGESMNNIVKNGAFALIHKQDTVENGEIAVVLINGYDATLKKFTKQGNVIVLEPDSSDNSFKTQVYDKNTPIKILGKYVGKMEINK